jgi:glucose/arabinose dehydrogenase
MRTLLSALAVTLFFAPQEKKKAGPGMDYGPFLSCAVISKPGAKFDNNTGNFDGDVTARGFLIKLADDWSAGAVFDSDNLRISAAWRGAPLKFTGVIFDGAHGPSPTLASPPVFQTPHGPGWAKDGSFKDPRADTIAPLPPPGPLPKDWGRYTGLYLNGGKAIFSYTVGKTPVLETMDLEGDAFARTLQVSASDAALELMIATAAPDLHVDAVGLPEGAKIVTQDHQVRLQLPPGRRGPFKILLQGGGDATKDAFAERVKSSPQAADLSALTKGGAPRWADPIETKGVLSKDKGPYVVDVLTLPEKNPWRAKMRIGGIDFFSDMTRAAVCTWDGDVWIVSNIDSSLEKLVWKRFATGLYQPLGLRIVNDQIYTVGHDQITRLHDLNGDGEADFYENFNNDWELTTAFHSFCFDLQTDPKGNFYFGFNCPVRAGGGGFHRITNHHGCILKVSPDGSKLDVYATGFRANNGMAVGPNGEVTSGDNEGTWVPMCPIHWVKPGSFNGVVDGAHRPLNSAKGKPDPAEQPRPICWMPKNVDNSSGGQVWVTSDAWGPFKGELLHTSYGTSSLFKVLKEEVNGQMQGGVVRFPVKFTSSAMRPRFNTRDGQLYVAGLRGWQSNAAREGGIDRVRYTGAPVCMPTGLNAAAKGMKVTFTSALDPETAGNPENYAVEVWNYRWTSNYGSGDYSTIPDEPGKPKDPKKKAHDPLTVKSAKLSDDGRSVFLEIEGMKPVMQMKIAMRIQSAEKAPANFEIYNTIHELAGQ